MNGTEISEAYPVCKHPPAPRARPIGNHASGLIHLACLPDTGPATQDTEGGWREREREKRESARARARVHAITIIIHTHITAQRNSTTVYSSSNPCAFSGSRARAPCAQHTRARSLPLQNSTACMIVLHTPPSSNLFHHNRNPNKHWQSEPNETSIQSSPATILASMPLCRKHYSCM